MPSLGAPPALDGLDLMVGERLGWIGFRGLAFASSPEEAAERIGLPDS